MDVTDYLNTKEKLKKLILKRMQELKDEKKELEERIDREPERIMAGILNRKVGEIDKLIEINFNFLSKIAKIGDTNEEVH